MHITYAHISYVYVHVHLLHVCIHIHVCVRVHIHAHLDKHGERCERIDPRCKLAMSIPHPDAFFSQLCRTHPSFGMLCWYDFICDIEKTALGTGANSFLRVLEKLGDYMFPMGFCTELSIKPLLPGIILYSKDF